MVELNDLPEGQEGDGQAFAGLDVAKATEMLSSVPNADISAVANKLAIAQESYRQHANDRRYIVEVLSGLGTIAGIAKSFVV